MNNRVRSLIKEALIATANYEVRLAESLPTPAFDFSSSFEKRIKEIEVGAPKKTKPQITSRRLVIAIIAAVLLLALSITACAYREQIGDLIESIFADHNEYDKVYGPTAEINESMTPMYIPDRYILTSRFISSEKIVMHWTNNDLFIDYRLTVLNNGTIFVDTEGATRGAIYIDGEIIDTFTKYNTVALVWDDGVYAYVLTCPEELGLEEIEKIIRSIEPVEDAGE